MTIPVFYSKQMVAPNTSYSPSAAKPAAVVEAWRRLGVPLAFHEPSPASSEELARAHDAAFVADVLGGRRPNGFGNSSPEVAASLAWTSGAMLSAARHLLATRAPVAAAPCSGFHHAGYARAGGFCTFNGLMVTAAALRAEGRVQRVGIIDCDTHYGDGTDDIIRAIGAQGWVRHFTSGARFQLPEDAPGFFDELPRIAAGMRGCDVVLYQAGADPHVDDPLGGWLTTKELARRDRIVFTELRAIGAPVVWNLAGGYQKDPDGGITEVLRIHDNTMRACAAVYLGWRGTD